MSAKEVIEQIKLLPREEQRKVAAYLDDIKTPDSSAKPGERVGEKFKRVADEVFTTNAELFRKLAK
jgi:hypothetical protein